MTPHSSSKCKGHSAKPPTDHMYERPGWLKCESGIIVYVKGFLCPEGSPKFKYLPDGLKACQYNHGTVKIGTELLFSLPQSLTRCTKFVSMNASVRNV